MKKQEAKQRTVSSLLQIARAQFTSRGYYAVSLEQIAEAGGVTRGAVYHHFKNKKGLFLAVLDIVQQDVAAHIEQQALQSEDAWQQLVLGCVGFVKGANAGENRRILLVDAPAVVGWELWRKADQENSMSVLQNHIEDLQAQGLVQDGVDTTLMTVAISGALNELALHYRQEQAPKADRAMQVAITQLLEGFRKASS